MPVRIVRRRYLAFKIYGPAPLNEEDLMRAINDETHFLYGVTGAASSDLRLIEYNPNLKRGILRCNHDRLNETRTVIARITTFNEEAASIEIIRVSGTIKALRKKLI